MEEKHDGFKIKEDPEIVFVKSLTRYAHTTQIPEAMLAQLNLHKQKTVDYILQQFMEKQHNIVVGRNREVEKLYLKK